MQEYSKEYFQKLAKQLMFSLSDEEVTELQQEFQVLEQQLDMLHTIDTESVEEMVYPFETPTTFIREDEPNHVLSIQDALKNADNTNDAYIILPRVVK